MLSTVHILGRFTKKFPLLTGGAVVEQLLKWLHLHFVEADEKARAALQHDRPQDHGLYWEAVSQKLKISITKLISLDVSENMYIIKEIQVIAHPT